ncbi:MAG: trypsin-like peptidase domain-containing protein [Deltaproteobacteria bacterium]|nr:trypsin-like peptidase domain-containing protein [Deltaproteobacteria bacterium]
MFSGLAHLLAFIFVLVTVTSETCAMNINDRLHLMTTLVSADGAAYSAQGSGFFYQQLGPPTKPGSPWHMIRQVWLVTNRHVVLPRINNAEVVPEQFTFNLRREEKGKLLWEPVILTSSELRKRTKLHPDPNVDVAVIEILDLLESKLDEKKNILQWYGVSEDDFAGQNKIEVEASDDIVVIGYPRSFYDEHNLFPIVKAGIIASRWGANFAGKPFFLIDAKLFPGSSGSIVLSKPRDFVMHRGQLLRSKEKQFAFLGIFSGEPFQQDRPINLENMIIIQKFGYDVGIVWYANLIPEIIKNGTAIDTK